MARYEISGLFSKTAAINICKKMQGKSYMNFDLYHSNYAGNYTIFVETDYDCTDEELQDMFIYCALNELAD